MIDSTTLDTIAGHFIIAAIWADAPEGTHPRATRAAIDAARRYAERFTSAYPELCEAVLACEDYGWHNGQRDAAAQFGYDLYLTARGHGVGFWGRNTLKDRELGERISAPFFNESRRWYIDAQFYRGWLYLVGSAQA